MDNFKMTKDRIIRQVQNQPCAMCNRYGTIANCVTPLEEMGEISAQNLIPLCNEHTKLFKQEGIQALYKLNKRKTIQWLEDKDRYDVSLSLVPLRSDLESFKPHLDVQNSNNRKKVISKRNKNPSPTKRENLSYAIEYEIHLEGSFKNKL